MSPSYQSFLHESARPSEGRHAFVPDGLPSSQAEIAVAELALGVTLPQSYKTFLVELGPGLWCGEGVKKPAELYPFDGDCGPMTGFVALVENVGGVGDYLAFNPLELAASEEPTLYYCGHDPFAVFPAASSFEAWAQTALAKLQRTEAHGRSGGHPVIRAASVSFGPHPRYGESRSRFELRWATYSFGWLCALSLLLAAFLVLGVNLPSLAETAWFKVPLFALPLGIAAALLATAGFLVKAARAKLFGPKAASSGRAKRVA